MNDRHRHLKRVGYWNNEHNDYPDLPLAKDFVDEKWDSAERERVAAYLEAGKEQNAWRGMSSCRFCKGFNGSTCLTDGIYVWPEGFAHYLLNHGVKPPQEFIDHVKKMLEEKSS